MPYITSVERIGMRKGMEQGLRQGKVAAAREDVIEAVRLRFQRTPRSLAKRLREVDDPSLLRRLLRKAITAASLEDFEKELPPQVD